jgi:hypothetical protein
MSAEREQTEKAADRIRDELFVTLRELDRRREEALDVRHQLVYHQREVEWVAAGLGVLLVAGIAIAIGQRVYRKRHRRQQFARALVRVWKHPERLASRASEKPPPQEIARKVVTSAATTVAVHLAKRMMTRMMPAEEP